MNNPKTLTLKNKSAVDLLEEGLNLVRSAPAGALLCYYAGSAPFILALLYFCSRMAAGAGSGDTLVPGALGLAFIFLWMKCWQAVYAHRLRAAVLNLGHEPVRPWRLITAQAAFQPWYFIAMPIALLLTIPLGWCCAFFQNITVLGWAGSEGSLFARAHRQAMLFQTQNFCIILILMALSCMVFVNLCAVSFFLPQMLKTLTGMETVFTRGAGFMLNSTFLLSMAGLTYLLVDPFRKAVYVLRCYYGDSIETGVDLLIELRDLRQSAGKALLLVIGICLLAAEPVFPADSREGPVCRPARGEPQSLMNSVAIDRAIKDVLARPEFSWRPLKAKRDVNAAKDKGGFSAVIATIREWSGVVGRWMDKALEWLRKKLQSGRDVRSPGSKRHDHDTLLMVMCLLLAVMLCVIGVSLRRRARMKKNREKAGTEQDMEPLPDLDDSSVTAAELPMDRWEQLAGELMERGEARLALRALYFACISHLAGLGLVVMDRCKSDRDYEKELARRARSRTSLIAAFSSNRAVYQSTWYGMHPADNEMVNTFMANYKGMVINET
jgi:hypothetical protein